MKNVEERSKTFAKFLTENVTETFRKRLGLDFLHGNNFSKQIRKREKCQRGRTLFFFTSSPIYSKIGEVVAAQLAQASSARPGEPGNVNKFWPGHDKIADWWSVGILLYEMLTRKDATNQQSLVIVYFGGNDSMHRHLSGLSPHVPLQEYIENMKKIVIHLKATRRTNEACQTYSEACLELCYEMKPLISSLHSGKGMIGLGSSLSMDSFASWKMNGSGMEKEEREETPLKGEDESRRSSPS
ncbi:GDSL esterase/lipase CPRD49 [Glycine soja]|uniref:GDSL esterase/lipase CPRD49 n=1 Tax=Glycine soja TaxID=3848 RepID=A0A445H688_GLYSO|nr:GDSL esterase/lipase CPRD49 [Glycine soja]